jgi:hypothetical protein
VHRFVRALALVAQGGGGRGDGIVIGQIEDELMEAVGASVGFVRRTTSMCTP